MKTNKDTFVLDNGRTITETERMHNDRIKAVYEEYWSKGISPKYQDGRCSTNEFIAVNRDGTEDLIWFDSQSRTYTIICRL